MSGFEGTRGQARSNRATTVQGKCGSNDKESSTKLGGDPPREGALASFFLCSRMTLDKPFHMLCLSGSL